MSKIDKLLDAQIVRLKCWAGLYTLSWLIILARFAGLDEATFIIAEVIALTSFIAVLLSIGVAELEIARCENEKSS